MDPISALNVACAVVQFVGFTSKILKGGFDRTVSSSGTTTGDANTEALVSELKNICNELSGFDTLAENAVLSQDEKSLEKVVHRCKDKAEELLELLESLRAQGSGIPRTGNALWQAVKREWKANRIEKLQKELDQIQQQVNTVLLSLVRNGQSRLVNTLNDMKKSSARLHIENGDILDDMRDRLVQSIKEYQERTTQNIDGIIDSIHALEKATETMNKTQLILKSLRFAEMPERQNRIQDAHAGTFDWILREGKTNFPTWLTSKSDVFWITGKPGSGKSTLMKYIRNHKAVQSMLETWAKQDNKTLVTASFYFWHSGTPLQRSQEGMFRTLLFQVLRKCPSMIAEVLPHLWQQQSDELATDGITWTYRTLSEAFKTFAQLTKAETASKYCFFIDGLDEYGEEPADLTPTIKQVMHSDSIKLCLASRPWAPFRNAYAKPDSMLVIQEFTRPDIKIFATALLEQEPCFRRLTQRGDQGKILVRDVIDKSQGVFLWVFLVVRSLVRGLKNGDDIDTLEQRLREMPADLNDFFARMLDHIENVYRKRAAMLLLTALQTRHLPLITFRYLPLEIKTRDAVLHVEHSKLRDDQAEAEAMIDEAQQHIDTCCRDLLELHYTDTEGPYEWLSIAANFTHRTVGEYLSKVEVQQSLIEHLILDSTFNAWRFMTQVCIFQAKSVPLDPRKTEQCHLLLHTARRATEHAKKYEQEMGVSSWPLMQELRRIDNHELFKAAKHSQEGWVHRLTPRLYFAVVLIRLGLTLSVRDMMLDREEPLDLEDSRELLVSLFHNGDRNGPCSEFEEMAGVLVGSGLDFNHRPQHTDHPLFNAWEVFLLCCQASTDNYTPRWWAMGRRMLELGADPWTLVVADDYDYLFTTKFAARRQNVLGVRQCLQSACSTSEKNELDIVLTKVERKQVFSPSHLVFILKHIPAFEMIAATGCALLSLSALACWWYISQEMHRHEARWATTWYTFA